MDATTYIKNSNYDECLCSLPHYHVTSGCGPIVESQGQGYGHVPPVGQGDWHDTLQRFFLVCLL